MQLPSISTAKTSRSVIEQFGGINERMRIDDNAFSDTENMTAKHYPLLASESAFQEARFETGVNCVGMTYNAGKVWYLRDLKYSSDLKYYLHLYNNSEIEHIDIELPGGERKYGGYTRTMVNFGAYIVIFPDKIYFNTTDYTDYGMLEKSFANVDTENHYNNWYVVIACDRDGKEFISDYYGSTEPTSPTDGYIWYDTNECVIKQFSTAYSMWITPTVYHKYRCLNIGIFDNDDSVEISRLGVTYTSTIVKSYHNDNPTGRVEHGVPLDADYIVIPETEDTKIVWNRWSESEQVLYNNWRSMISVERKVPQMDYVCESQGRIWGCRYGETEKITYKEHREKLATGESGEHLSVSVSLEDGETLETILTYWLYDDSYNRIDNDEGVTGSPKITYDGNGQFSIAWNGYTGSANVSLDYTVKATDVLNEIYASRQQNFKCWSYYQGTALDSYTASIGHTGPFTGAINYNGRPLFSKTDRIYEIYGSYPAQYQLQENCIEGVSDGASETMCICNGILIFKGENGVYGYSSSSSSYVLSEAVENGVRTGKAGGQYNGIYYLETDNGMYVYDVSRQIWHRKNTDGLNLVQFLTTPYGIAARDATHIIPIEGAALGKSERENIEKWSAETGLLGLSVIDEKYVNRITLRYKGSALVEVDYNNRNEFQTVAKINADTNITTFNIPPTRCGSFRLRFSGKGEFYLYALALTMIQGSDTRNVNV